jgi:hypothetical protein
MFPPTPAELATEAPVDQPSGVTQAARVPKEVAVDATMTLWVNTITGERLDRGALDDLHHKAHQAYEANPHIFEDEYDALTALGAVPLSRLHEDTLGIA